MQNNCKRIAQVWNDTKFTTQSRRRGEKENGGFVQGAGSEP